MIKTILVDDEKKSLNILIRLIETHVENIDIIGSATDIDTARELIEESRPQLVFLDIEMGPRSGFDLLESMEEIDFHVIFVTAHEEFALKAIKISALDYLIKPVGIQELKGAVNKVEKQELNAQSGHKITQLVKNFYVESPDLRRITLPTSEGFEFVPIRDILYCRADGSYSHIFLKDGQKITTSKNLKFYSDILEDYAFYRIHNTSLINLRYIRKFGKSAGGYVIMEDGKELSVSKSKKPGLLDQFGHK
ncbi:response regulator transcription factor [bacterium SCSIO 12741]|nr:response regulator transcription factor [bacterium SCSIO 12741]